MSGQFLRKMTMVVANAAGDGLDLSTLHVRFATRQADIQTPATLYARIYNMSEPTVSTIQKEYTQVVLQAGYDDPSDFGIIFKGTIKQVKVGRETNTDSYLELYCANNDQAYNFAVVNSNLAAGATPEDQIVAILKELKVFGITNALQAGLGTDGLPRGKVFYGNAKDLLRDICRTANCSYVMVGNRIQIIPNTPQALAGTAVVLTSQTGLVGTPEQTESGVRGRCLMNPNIKPGRLLNINNASINQTVKLAGNDSPGSGKGGFFQQYDSWTGFQYLAGTRADGFYKTLVAEHVGDNRGQEWYTNFICLALGDTIPPSIVARGISA